MRNLLGVLYEKWQERRRARAVGVLDDLKVRYHTFRALLANNELALNLLRSVEQSLTHPGPSRENLEEDTEELLNVTYELVDGLNLLTGDRYDGLYDRHQHLAAAIHKELDTVAAQPTRAPYCIFFGDLTRSFHSEVGGKAGNLALLKQTGFPVPEGFALTTRACAEILSANGLDLFIRRMARELEKGGSQAPEVEGDAAAIRERILDAVLPTGVEYELRAAYERLTNGGQAAVSARSSALIEDRPEHSFAGQFKSVLNITSFDALATAVNEVIASSFNTRSILYRFHAGLPLTKSDMAVLCQRMAPARAAGGLFTVDPAAPESGRMLLSAVPGLGITAVSGSAPTDLYRPLRDAPGHEPMSQWAQIAAKTHRAVSLPGGGVQEEQVPDGERDATVLSEDEIHSLVRLGRMIESLIGRPQDIEWAVSHEGEMAILQSRDIRLAVRDRQAVDLARGEIILKTGVPASPGRRVGRVKIVRSAGDVEEWRREEGAPSIMVLHHSMVDAAGWLPEFKGVVVDLGNPTDHLSVVAREYSIPMLTGTGKATEMLRDGQWVILDADRAMVLQAPEDVWSQAAAMQPSSSSEQDRPVHRSSAASPELARLREMIETLNLTDAYGPTFSIQECKSLHDVIRYTHEMAVLAMFDIGDDVLEEAEVLLRRLDTGMPLHFLIIDLGGGIVPDRKGFRIRLGDVLSVPFLALWRGISTPGLRWNKPPPVPGISGLVSRSLLDAASSRPVGQQNYAMITRDYLNLNARVDYHFAMLDAVCGPNPRENYIRFRFKGGGTTKVQRERRARFISDVLEAQHFFSDQRGDLVTASIMETPQEEIEERLVMLGRLLGFSRLLDAAMQDDTVPAKVAQAFLEGDYALEGLKEELALS